MPNPRFAALIAKLPETVPFVGPEAQERMRNRPFRARIGANESVFGPSPRAVAAMCAAAAESWMYGDPEIHRSHCLLYVSVDEGVGIGIVLGGKVYHGPRMAAGEFGQIAVQRP